VVWEKPFLTGEANMCHSLENLEYHHFKYAAHRRPGDVHLHFFGTATLSFADGVRTQPGDVFEIDLPELGAPLRNTLRSVPAGFRPGGVRPLKPRKVRCRGTRPTSAATGPGTRPGAVPGLARWRRVPRRWPSRPALAARPRAADRTHGPVRRWSPARRSRPPTSPAAGGTRAGGARRVATC